MIILLYHNVIEHRPSAFNMLARPDWLTVDEFEEEIASLAERFDIVSVDDIANAVREGRRIPRACAVTFDDGYLGAYTYGLPVLEKHGATAAFFVITDQLNGDASSAYDFFDRLEAQVWLTKAERVDLTAFGLDAMPLTCDACKLTFMKAMSREFKALPGTAHAELNARLAEQLAVGEEQLTEYLSHEAFRPMSWVDVDGLRKRGCIVGSHSRSHRALSQLNAQALQCEVDGSYDDLRSHSIDGALTLAYPFGQEEHYNDDVIATARSAGYSSALTAIAGVNDDQTDVFALRRATFRDLKKLRKAF